jgi:DNA-directed RNA polymerase subunit H (RpoH/RPB5)
MALNPQLIPIKYDQESVRKIVLKNILKMFVARGVLTEDGLKKYQEKFNHATDDNIYKIELSTPIKSDIKDPEFEGKYVVIKLIPQKITSIKSPIIKEFIDANKKKHKLIVFDSISDKARKILTSAPNLEVFDEPFFMINLIDFIDSPKYNVLTEQETEELLEEYNVKRKQLMKILINDPVCFYYNLKRGQVLRINRYSEQTGHSIGYRIVAKANY